MYTICAFDQSTNHYAVAIITVDKSTITLEDTIQYIYKKATTIEKLVRIYKDVYGYLKDKHVDVVTYENIFAGKNISTLRILSEGLGCLKIAVAASIGTDVPLLEIYRKQALVAICSNGNASKEDVIEAVDNLFDARLSSDCADAVALAFGTIFAQRQLIEDPFFASGWDIPMEKKKCKNSTKFKYVIDLKEAATIGRGLFEFKSNYKPPYKIE